MAKFDELLTSLRQEFGETEVGKKFEVFCKWFLENDPAWRCIVDKVWLWQDWSERWGPDCGIDLVFRHKNGDFWAVQAKCYSSSNTVSKKDIDTFLSESSRSLIAGRLLLTTTNLLSKNARATMVGQEKPVQSFLLHDFQRSVVEFPDDYSALTQVQQRQKPTPRAHQEEAITNVVQGLTQSDRGQLIMACGTGKTLTSLWIKERLNAQRVLVLLPSLNLLSQTLVEWTAAATQSFEVLCVCSDKSVVKRAKEDMAIAEFAYPVSNELGKIENFLSRPQPQVVFCTYQSAGLIASALKNKNIKDFDVTIFDEAHRCASDKNSIYTIPLINENIRSQKRLFCTATPKIYLDRIKSRAEEFGTEFISMDDEAYFGKVLHTLSFGEAIKRDLLCDYKVAIVGIDDVLLKTSIETRTLFDLNGKSIDARTLASGVSLLNAIDKYELHRMITFHSRVQSAENFAHFLKQIAALRFGKSRLKGTLHSKAVKGTMPTHEREHLLNELREVPNGEFRVLTNARCLSEGVDVPSLDGIAFIDPKQSQLDIIQAVGRAMRRSENKQQGLIVIPVFLEEGSSSDEILKRSEFKIVWNVLKALRSHDEILSEELDQLRRNLGKPNTDTGHPTKIIIDLPQQIPEDIFEKLNVKLIEATTETWGFWVELYTQYVRETGNLHAPNELIYRGYNLGNWVRSVRTRFKNGRLSTQRVEELSDLKFVWDQFLTQWNANLLKLQVYFEKFGTSLVPQRYGYAEGELYGLGVWVSTQRENYENLSSDQKDKLEAFEDWSWHIDPWSDNFDFVQKLLQDKNMPISDIPNDLRIPGGPLIYNWLSSQRNNFREGKLEKEKIKELESLSGWYWDYEEWTWMQNFEEVKNYYEEYKRPIPKNFRGSHRKNLNSWVKDQRANKNELDVEKYNLLDSLPLWSWDPFEDAWQRGLEAIREFERNNEHLWIKQRFVDSKGFALGTFVNKLRNEYRKGILNIERLKTIDEIQGWIWNPILYKWDEYFDLAVKMNVKLDKGRLLDTGLTLQYWLKMQRANFKKLSRDKQTKLVKSGLISDVK